MLEKLLRDVPDIKKIFVMVPPFTPLPSPHGKVRTFR